MSGDRPPPRSCDVRRSGGNCRWLDTGTRPPSKADDISAGTPGRTTHPDPRKLEQLTPARVIAFHARAARSRDGAGAWRRGGWGWRPRPVIGHWRQFSARREPAPVAVRVTPTPREPVATATRLLGDPADVEHSVARTVDGRPRMVPAHVVGGLGRTATTPRHAPISSARASTMKAPCRRPAAAYPPRSSTHSGCEYATPDAHHPPGAGVRFCYGVDFAVDYAYQTRAFLTVRCS
jgi:hypothetical protein